MYRREHHRLIGRLLSCVSSDVLERSATGFGGGTRIALVLGEYRESRDVDFLCSDARGYAELRTLVRDGGPGALLHPEAGITFPREPRVDQYGIRFPVAVDGVSIRVEVVREGRITLGPFERDTPLSVPCLNSEDCFAEKLLANSDRWADADILSRDLLDLAMLAAARGPVPEAAVLRAEGAYGSVLRRDLEKARSAFLSSPEHQARCMRGLGIEDPAAALSAVQALQLPGA